MVGWGCFAAEGVLPGYPTAQVSEASREFVPARYLYLLDLVVRAGARRQVVASEVVCRARLFAGSRGLAAVKASWLVADASEAAFWRVQGFCQYLARARTKVMAEAPPELPQT